MTTAKVTYSFNHEQIVTAMLKERDLHEGLWQLSIGFSMMGAVAGPTQEQALPSAIIGVQSIGLESVDQPGPMVFDAARLNP